MAYPQIHGRKKDLRGPEKVAAVLLAVSKPAASRLLKHFNDVEVALIAAAASTLGIVAAPVLNAIIDEFAQSCSAGEELEGGATKIEELLSGVIPADQLLDIMSQVRGQNHRAVWPKLSASAPNAIFQYLAKEHPQTAAFALSRTSPTCAANVTTMMPSN